MAEGQPARSSSAASSTLQATSSSAYTPREQRIVIAAAFIGWGLEYFDLMLVALLATPIGKEFGVGKSALGAVLTAQLVATALGGIAFGWAGDVFGRRRVLSWTIWVFAVSTGLAALSPNFASFVALRFITGFGVGGEWAVGFALLNEAWSPKRRGLAGGVVQSGIWPAFALAILVTSIVPSWRWAFAVGVLPAIAAVFIRKVCPESRQWEAARALEKAGVAAGRPQRQPLVEIFGPRTLGIVVLGTLVVLGAQYAYYVYSAWMPTYLKETLGFGKAQANAILYTAAVISLLAYIVAGYLGDLWGRRRALLTFAAVQLVAFAAFAGLNAVHGATAAIVASYFVISVGVGYFSIFGVWFGELFPTRVRATGSSFCYSVGRGLASFGPWVVGVLAAKHGLGGGISTGVLAVVLVMVIASFMSERTGRVITAEE